MRLFLLICIILISSVCNAGGISQDDDILFNNDPGYEVTENNEQSRTSDEKTNYSINGKVFIGENLLPEGTVYLLNASKGGRSFWKMDFTEGEFRINNLNLGKYRVLVIPANNYNFNYFPNYFPTYYRKTNKWNNSRIIEIYSDNIDIKFDLLSYLKPVYGHFSISGELIFSDNSKINRDLPVIIYLMNEDKELIDFRVLYEESGKYKFQNLPEGHYYIYPESPGINSPEYEVFLNDEYNQFSTDFIAQNDVIELNRMIVDDINTSFDRYYCRIFLNREINEPIVCELYSTNGASVFKKIFNSNIIEMNTRGLCAGIYILKVNTFTNTFIKTKKVYINNN